MPDYQTLEPEEAGRYYQSIRLIRFLSSLSRATYERKKLAVQLTIVNEGDWL